MMIPRTNGLNGRVTSPSMYAAAVPAETVPVATLSRSKNKASELEREPSGEDASRTHTSSSVTAAPSKLIALPETFSK